MAFNDIFISSIFAYVEYSVCLIKYGIVIQLHHAYWLKKIQSPYFQNDTEYGHAKYSAVSSIFYPPTFQKSINVLELKFM